MALDYAKLGDEFDSTNLNYDSLVTEFDGGNQSTLSKVAKRAKGALPLGSDFSEGYQRGINRSTTRISEAAKDIGEHGFGPSNIGSMALGGLEYLATPFEGAGTFLANPIRRAAEGVPGAEIVAQTAELAPLMAAPIPGAKAIQGIGGGVGSVMGEAPAAMAALKNAIPVIKEYLGLAPAVEREAAAVFTPKSDMLPGQTAKTGRVTEREGVPNWAEPDWSPDEWYSRQFRGGNDVPEVPPTSFAEPRDILGPKKKVGKNTTQETLIPNYQNMGDRPTLRTGHLPRVQEPAADENYFAGAFADDMQGRNVSTDVPLVPGPPELEYMRLPTIRENTQLDPALEQQIKDAYFRKQQTTPMREQTGGGMPWAPTREPVGDPLDELYKGYFTGESPGGVPPTFPVGPRPNIPTINRSSPNEPFQAGPPMADASNDNLDARYGRFFRSSNRPALKGNAQEPLVNAEGIPPAPRARPTPIPTKRGAQSTLDDPTQTDLTRSNPELYYNWDDKNPALFGKPPMDEPLPPVPPKPTPSAAAPTAVSPPMAAAPNEAALRDRLKSFKGGPISAAEVPAEPMPAPPARPAPKPVAATIPVGTEVEIVHSIGGQEMRAPGGRIVEVINKPEPKFNKGQLRAEDGSMPERVTYEDRAYAKLEDGREVPMSLLQPLKAEPLPAAKPKTRVTSKAVKATAPAAKSEAIGAPPGAAEPKAVKGKFKKMPDIADYTQTPEEKILAKEVTKASQALQANPSVENNDRFNAALQALHAASPKVETAAERALKAHMEAQSKTYAKPSAPIGKSKSVKTPNKGRKTSKETAAKQSAAHKAQNAKKDVSSVSKKDD